MDLIHYRNGAPLSSRATGGIEERRHPGALIELLGGHAATQLGFDLEHPDEETLARWLLASALLGGRTPEAKAAQAWRALDREGLLPACELGAHSPSEIEAPLRAAGLAKPEVAARLLLRAAGTLRERWDGSIERLAAASDSLEELSGQLCALAPGIGRAAAMRFLTPLRRHWSIAGDLPATASVCAAAADLGLASPEDYEGVPARLGEWIDASGGNESVRDLEAALDRLGRRACLRGRTERCPLGSACPQSGPTGRAR